MSDNHFSAHLHASENYLRLLDDRDEEAAVLNQPLPDEDIDIRRGLIPPYMSAEEEGVLPSMLHPSYPFGNPYKLPLLPLRAPPTFSRTALKANPHTRHAYTWADLALEDLLPWEGGEPDPNYWAGQEAEAAAATHAATQAAAAAAPIPADPANPPVEVARQPADDIRNDRMEVDGQPATVAVRDDENREESDSDSSEDSSETQEL